MPSPAWRRAARDLSHCDLDTRPASSLLTADLAANVAEYVGSAGTNQPDSADHDDKHHRQHDGVLGNVLTIFVVPKVAGTIAIIVAATVAAATLKLVKS